MRNVLLFLILAAAMLKWPLAAEWFVYSCLALFFAYGVVWLGAWLRCLTNRGDGREQAERETAIRESLIAEIHTERNG